MSKYNGLFISDYLQLYKTLEDIGIEGSSPIEIENRFADVRRKHEGNTETICFPDGANGMIYRLAKKSRIYLRFDCRKVNDLRSFGRYYAVEIGSNGILVSFTKRTDSREDQTNGEDEFSLFVAIHAKGFDPKKDLEGVDSWSEIQYSYDAGRKDSPQSRYNYTPFIINAKELIISAGLTKEEAISGMESLRNSKDEDRQVDSQAIDRKKAGPAAAAFACAQDSLHKLLVVHENSARIYAGLPWFFQFWSRDELISLGALIRTGQFSNAKDILFEYMRNIGEDGRLPNRIPSSELSSADSIGWFWKRMGDFINALRKQDALGKFISDRELSAIKAALAGSISKIENAHMKSGLIDSRCNETWMDTQWQGQDGREGAAIEVQALHLNMLRLAQELAEDDKERRKFKTKETAMRNKVVSRFWNGSLLADTADNYTIRPNIFIAYYVYPELLARKDWQTAFENALNSLWLDWGGLSSIDLSHPLFTPDYTGADNRSYHRGDSWFWINNLAAICLHRNNAIVFEEKVKRIVEASSEEMLWHGAIGHHAEVSDASHLASRGCFAQAWSAAMFIELVMEKMGGGK
ncbi:hypothetical protein KY363_03955 [Candidatus Woesearchaeota archaeon]|nr:hypothetical protein [Candidatus Woesearchaeota archaeon]